MMRLIALIGCLLLSAIASSAVQTTDRVRINLLRGSSTVATLDSWESCRAEALRRAALETRTSGTLTFTCQTERRDVVATYSPNAPAPVDCVVGPFGAWTGGEWSACSGGSQSRQESRSRSIVTPPANGGAQCPVLTETRTATQACAAPPSGALVFGDDFEYVVDRLSSASAKAAAFTAAGYTGIKDEVTQPGRASGYIYTRTTAPGCGPAPSGRMLTFEGRASQSQTDFYLQLGNGLGSIPARAYIQIDLCLSRSGAEMSSIEGTREKLFYPLFGSRDGYPMATEDTAWMLNMSKYAYRGSTMTTAPEPGAFTFMTQANPGSHGLRAVIDDQLSSGSGSMMSPNVGDPWIRPNRWYTARFLLDVSGPQGIYRVWVAPVGSPLVLVADFTGGVTPGFNYLTGPLDRLGAKALRFPTTWGPQSNNAGTPDIWLNIDRLRLATSTDALN